MRAGKAAAQSILPFARRAACSRALLARRLALFCADIAASAGAPPPPEATAVDEGDALDELLQDGSSQFGPYGCSCVLRQAMVPSRLPPTCRPNSGNV